MGKGGGGGGSQPQTTTAYQTNLPEYAQPYVMNMLGAAQNQLFTTTPGTNGQPGEITGFKPYQAYSTNPTDYFAGPSSLQTSAYNAASQLQSPSQYQLGSQLAGMSGMGQLGTAGQAGMYGQQGSRLGLMGAMQAAPAFGAGQQYASQATDPNAVAQYMSPYQQQVTDIAKSSAVREAQIAGQQANLGAARQGTYGGARQALAGAEREKNLLANLSNIQAQGSQSAYDRAIASQQFGANLGLQGIQTGLQGVQAGMQGIGQGLQGVGAQQAGYAGAGQAASTLGQLGGAQQQGDIAAINLQNQLGGQQQQYQQGIINQAIQDYATAQQYPYMQLSTMSNLLRGLPMQGMTTQQYQAQPSTSQQLLGLAGTGASLYGAMKREGGTIKEYASGGSIRDSLESKIDDIGDAGKVKGLQALLAQTKSPQAKQMIMDRMREEGIGAAPTGKLGTNMAGGGIIAFEEGGSTMDKLRDFFYAQGEWAPEKNRMSARYQGDSPLQSEGLTNLYKKNQARKKDVEEQERLNARESKEFGEPIQRSNEDPYAAANPVMPNSAPGVSEPPTTAPVNTPAANTASQGRSETGLDAAYADRRRRLGIDGPGEKSEALMKAIEERQAGMGKERESDRYLRAAEAFAKFGSTAGPIGVAASEALGGFAKGEAAARRDEDKMKLEGMKMQADLEKARRAEDRGDLEAAEKFYGSAEDRKSRLDAAKIAASASGQTAQLDRDAIAQVMKDNPNMTYLEALQAVRGAGRAETTTLQNQKAVLASLDAQILTAKKEEKAALMRKRDEIYNQMLKMAPSGNVGLNKDQQALLDKYK